MTLGRVGMVGVLLLAPASGSAQLLVTSHERGILRVGPRGEVVEVLSSTPAGWGRMRGTSAVVFLGADGRTLRELELVTRAERVITVLPSELGLGCGGVFGSRGRGSVGAPYALADHLQFEESMAVDDARACFEVMDRNLNMASVILDVEVSLATGAVTHQVTISEDCGSLDSSAIDAIPCTALFRAAARARSTGAGRARARRMPWRLEGDGESVRLVGPRHRRARLAIVDALVEAVSADGRWALVGGNVDSGDYIYRQLYLLDLRRGALHPIAFPEGEGPATYPWPEALPRAALADATRLREAGFGATGETSIAWIEAGRTLVLGGSIVVRPGREIVRLPGALVR